MRSRGRTSSIGRHLVVLLLATTGVAPLAARAQDATWLAAPGTNSFNTGANWSTGVVPTGVATFGASNTTTIAAGGVIGGFTFNAGAPAYTFNLGEGLGDLFFTGAGIVNNSPNTPTIIGGLGRHIHFEGSSSAGDATINVAGVLFHDTSSAGNATLIVTTSSGFFDSASGGQARIINNAIPGHGFQISGLTGAGTTVGSIEGTGSFLLGTKQLTTGGNNLSTTASGVISGAGGSLVKVGTGTLTLTGANTYTGATTVLGGRLAINGSITSDVTVGAAGNLGGTGTIFGAVVNNGILAPGNSIGTLTVNGSYTQAAGSVYQVEVNAAGQSDRINVTGAPGTATINGGTVNVIAAPGNYGRSTTYTILNATGGVTGTYAGVTSNFAFLTPTLAYDANNVFLTLLLRGFTYSGLTPNQTAVGNALDQAFAGASGDFATVLDALTGLSSAEAPQALDQLGGEVYSGFALAGIQASRLFMNEVGRQMTSVRGGTHSGSRMAVAPAFDGACSLTCGDSAPSPWSAWAAALGGTGRVTGDISNTHSATYTIGGFAAGVDYRLDRRFLVGLGAGYMNSTHYLGGLDGRGTTDAYRVALYASLNEGAFYLDGLAGYGYDDNRMRRTIAFAGFVPRTASGHTHAHQFIGQAEMGYRLGLYAPADASLTPFARLQASTSSQAAFSESGAGSIDLNVAGQATNSVRSIVGAELAGAIDAGWREKIALQLRLGWAHEYVDVSHPVTASFAGAPANGFTVFGAVPSRDSAIVSLAANTAIGRATGLYLRYDGDISSYDSSHALSVGARMTW